MEVLCILALIPIVLFVAAILAIQTFGNTMEWLFNSLGGIYTLFQGVIAVIVLIPIMIMAMFLTLMGIPSWTSLICAFFAFVVGLAVLKEIL